jgi:hypothetical protein
MASVVLDDGPASLRPGQAVLIENAAFSVECGIGIKIALQPVDTVRNLRRDDQVEPCRQQIG